MNETVVNRAVDIANQIKECIMGVAYNDAPVDDFEDIYTVGLHLDELLSIIRDLNKELEDTEKKLGILEKRADHDVELFKEAVKELDAWKDLTNKSQKLAKAAIEELKKEREKE